MIFLQDTPAKDDASTGPPAWMCDSSLEGGGSMQLGKAAGGSDRRGRRRRYRPRSCTDRAPAAWAALPPGPSRPAGRPCFATPTPPITVELAAGSSFTGTLVPASSAFQLELGSAHRHLPPSGATGANSPDILRTATRAAPKFSRPKDRCKDANKRSAIYNFKLRIEPAARQGGIAMPAGSLCSRSAARACARANQPAPPQQGAARVDRSAGLGARVGPARPGSGRRSRRSAAAAGGSRQQQQQQPQAAAAQPPWAQQPQPQHAQRPPWAKPGVASPQWPRSAAALAANADAVQQQQAAQYAQQQQRRRRPRRRRRRSRRPRRGAARPPPTARRGRGASRAAEAEASPPPPPPPSRSDRIPRARRRRVDWDGAAEAAENLQREEEARRPATWRFTMRSAPYSRGSSARKAQRRLLKEEQQPKPSFLRWVWRKMFSRGDKNPRSRRRQI